jgi:hypothetical protein
MAAADTVEQKKQIIKDSIRGIPGGEGTLGM